MKKEDRKKIIKTLFEELEKTTQPGGIETPKVKAKETVVKFDTNTSPYEVIFSERGFEISGTRFSFEFLETALSKEINIVLEKGSGLVLDSVKMEKILKYKDLYSNKSGSSF